MSNAFLLRFQEPCSEVEMGEVLGTATKTSTREQPDTDPASKAHSALASGTETFTKILNEHKDSDATGASKAFPRTAISMGTETVTNVRAETSDTDPGQLVNRVLSR